MRQFAKKKFEREKKLMFVKSKFQIVMLYLIMKFFKLDINKISNFNGIKNFINNFFVYLSHDKL